MQSYSFLTGSLPLLVGFALLSGCGVGVPIGGDDTGEVRRTEESVADCTFVAEVDVVSSPSVGPNATEDMLYNKARAAGGNVLLVTEMGTQQATGEAYDCGDEDQDDS